MVYNAAARYELIGRYYSGVVSRLCIRSLHAVITVLLHARLNTHEKAAGAIDMVRPTGGKAQ